jgi:hypothetical protein
LKKSENAENMFYLCPYAIGIKINDNERELRTLKRHRILYQRDEVQKTTEINLLLSVKQLNELGKMN